MKITLLFFSLIIISGCNTNSVVPQLSEKSKKSGPYNGTWGGEIYFTITPDLYEAFQAKCSKVPRKYFKNPAYKRQRATIWVNGNQAVGYIQIANKTVNIEEKVTNDGHVSFNDYRINLMPEGHRGEMIYLDLSGHISLTTEEKSVYGRISVSEFGKKYSCGGEWRLYKHWN